MAGRTRAMLLVGVAFIALVVVVLVVLDMHRKAELEAMAPDGLPVACHAIAVESRSWRNFPFESPLEPELVVGGIVRNIGEADTGNSRYEIRINEVFYGMCKQRKVVFTASEQLPEDVSNIIVALAPGIRPDDGEWSMRYWVPGDEKAAARALAVARLDFTALSSDLIFVGNEVDNPKRDPWLKDMTVKAVLSGEGVKAGDKVSVQWGRFISRGDESRIVEKETRIYFCIKNRAEDKDAKLTVLARLPEGRQPDVLAALKRRKSYPIIENSPETQEAVDEETNSPMDEGCVYGYMFGALDRARYGTNSAYKPPAGYREIVFRGSIDECLDLLASTNEAARTLAMKTLYLKKEEAVTFITETLGKEMICFQPVDSHRPLKIRKLIEQLKFLKDGERVSILETLTDKYLRHISSGPPQPPDIPASEEKIYRELAREDVNHSLAWLLMAMDPMSVCERFGDRLLELEGKTTGNWQHEIQLAIDACALKDRLSLPKALERMKHVESVSSHVPLRNRTGASIRRILFSHNGSYLAVAGGSANGHEVSVFETTGMARLCSFETEQIGDMLAFSPDDEYLYIVSDAVRRIETRTGKLDHTFTKGRSYYTMVAIGPDNQVMVTGDHWKNRIDVWDLTRKVVVRSFEIPGGWVSRSVAIRPDCQMVVWGYKDTLNVANTTDGSIQKIKANLDGEVMRALYSPDRHYLFMVVKPEGEGTTCRMMCFDASKSFSQVGEVQIDYKEIGGMAISPDGSLVVLGAYNRDKQGIYLLPDQQVLSFTAPDLSILKSVRSAPGTIPKSLAFSPNGKLVAVANQLSLDPDFIDVDSLELLERDKECVTDISGLAFCQDGKHLRTYSTDKVVTTWDADTLKIVGQLRLDATGMSICSISPDGNYLVTAPERDRQGVQKEKKPTDVRDAQTGRVVSLFDLNTEYGPDVQWLSNNQALLIGKGNMLRVNYLTGEVLQEYPADDWWLRMAHGSQFVDDNKLFCLGGGGRCVWIGLKTFDLKTGNAIFDRTYDYYPFSWRGDRGLVPGGKLVYFGRDEIMFFSRDVFDLDHVRRFTQRNNLSIAFSPDGKTYAAFIDGTTDAYKDVSGYSPAIPGLVQIHDTASGELLLAFQTPSKAQEMRFSPDGKRLLLVNADSSMEWWPIPDIN